MRLQDFLARFIKKSKIGTTESVVIEIPAELYYKEMAIYTARSYIANAISMCEMRVFEDKKRVKNLDYYRLNIAPNKNENSNYFWHKVIRKMFENREGALVVEIHGELHCAESFSIREERPILGNLYDGVVLEGGFQLKKIFRAQDVYLFKMEDESVRNLVDGIYEDYGKMLRAAARAFKDTNGRKYKLKVDAVKAGDEQFEKDFKEIISKNIKDYMEKEYATYVEYDGEELVEDNNGKDAKTADDMIKLRKDIFEIVGQAFKIPSTLMTGNVTSLKEVCDVFLTFAVDPFANVITKTLNKRATFQEYERGNYYKCYSGNIKHRDIFDVAPSADKLIGASILNTDEVREELEKEPLNKPWSKKYRITKNYGSVESQTNVTEGGEGNV